MDIKTVRVFTNFKLPAASGNEKRHAVIGANALADFIFYEAVRCQPSNKLPTRPLYIWAHTGQDEYRLRIKLRDSLLKKSLLILSLIWLVGCSSPSPTAKKQALKFAQNIPQSFWVGHSFSKSDGIMDDSIGVCQRTPEHSSAVEMVTTPINALLKVVTLGIYTPQYNGETCP